MKYLRKFDSVSAMEITIASSEIGIIGLAYNGTTPVIKKKDMPSGPVVDPTTPFYVENITNEAETLTIGGADGQSGYIQIPVEYSTDGTAWSSFGTTGETPLAKTLHPGEKVYLRATTNAWFDYPNNYGCHINGVSKVGGNVMSLIYGSGFTGNETSFPNGSLANLADIFDPLGATSLLRNASELILPATTLADGCYYGMFSGCTSLTTAPALPATTLAQSCYQFMFYGCTSLTTAPTLPATTLANYCYDSMFNGCTSLTQAPELPATTLAASCYNMMFQRCTSLTTAPILPATTLASRCYSYMFDGCTSLTTAPDLPATTLANYCCSGMFSGCTSLTTAPELPATTLADNCYTRMFDNCTSLTTAPDLPATILAQGCYSSMFWDCTNLNYIKCLATDISASACTINWVYHVSSTGTFVKDPNMTSWTTGINGIPEGWTVQNDGAGPQ